MAAVSAVTPMRGTSSSQSSPGQHEPGQADNIEKNYTSIRLIGQRALGDQPGLGTPKRFLFS